MQSYIRPQAATTVQSMPYPYSTRAVTTAAPTYSNMQAPAYSTVQAPAYSTIATQPAMYSTIGATSLPTTYPAATMAMAAPAATMAKAATVISGTRTAMPVTQTFGSTQLAPQILQTMAQPMAQTVMVQAAQPLQTTPTYFGSQGQVLTVQSANLLAAGRVVSERVVSPEECYSSGLVRVEAAVQEVVQVQPVVETFVMPDGQVELVQAEIVTEVLQTAEGQVIVETLVEEGVVPQQEAGPPRVVMICTSANQLGDGGQATGAWSEEITGPYYVFAEAGCEVYIASIMGGKVPIDEASLSENFLTGNDQRFAEEGCSQFLENSYAIGDVSPEAIDCVWLAGGHGTCMDFESNLAQFVTDAHALGRPIGAVCHGVIGLLGAITQEGAPLLQGKQVTGFSNAEEEQVGLLDKVPFLIQERMQELQADYSCAEPWNEYAIRDGKIITGQNPQSSVRAAQLCVEAMMQP